MQQGTVPWHAFTAPPFFTSTFQISPLTFIAFLGRDYYHYLWGNILQGLTFMIMLK